MWLLNSKISSLETFHNSKNELLLPNIGFRKTAFYVWFNELESYLKVQRAYIIVPQMSLLISKQRFLKVVPLKLISAKFRYSWQRNATKPQSAFVPDSKNRLLSRLLYVLDGHQSFQPSSSHNTQLESKIWEWWCSFGSKHCV